MIVNASRAKRPILVTGAGGFVGNVLCALLATRAANESLQLHVFNNRDDLDLTDPVAVEVAVERIRPFAVINLAAVAAPQEARADPQLAWNVNLFGPMNLARAVLRHAPEARFIQIGSSEAYGESFAQNAAPLTEDVPLRPMTTYASTKAAADLMIGQMTYEGLKAVRFRPFNHTGPGQAETYVISSFAKQIAEILIDDAEPVIRVGNLKACRDFLDVRDVARAYADAILCENFPTGGVFNLASERAETIETYLDMMISASGRKIRIEQDPKRMHPNDIPVAVGSAKAAFETFGWSPQIPFEKTLSDVLADWKQRLTDLKT